MKEKDNSVAVGVTMMVLFGFIGATVNDISGLIYGAIFGFAVTAIVYGAQDTFK